ncbi:MAG: glycosyltransferase, partial [Thermoleophilia bacterium]|nr:glycosyltransferase [Thermoleophilia bacterium]
IAVVDVTDEVCMQIAHSLGVRVIETDVPGKRDALRRGWEAASHELVALVDSDTIWAPDVADRVCEPFADPKVGGVGTRQNAYRTDSVWQQLADAYLDYRYFDELPSQSHVGQAVSCLSGRTAVYRKYVLEDISEDFMSETFWGVPCNSGDDKRLTMLTLRRGFKTIFQQNARVFSTFPADFDGFVKQRVRWARNTWRSDLRAMGSGWIARRHRWLLFVMIDKAISPFTLLLSGGFMLYAIATSKWWIAIALAAWWMTSRTAKFLPHLRRLPKQLALIPTIVVASFLMASIRLFALTTIRRQRWLTRQVAVVNGQIQRTGTAPAGLAAAGAGLAVAATALAEEPVAASLPMATPPGWKPSNRGWRLRMLSAAGAPVIAGIAVLLVMGSGVVGTPSPAPLLPGPSAPASDGVGLGIGASSDEPRADADAAGPKPPDGAAGGVVITRPARRSTAGAKPQSKDAARPKPAEPPAAAPKRAPSQAPRVTPVAAPATTPAPRPIPVAVPAPAPAPPPPPAPARAPAPAPAPRPVTPAPEDRTDNSGPGSGNSGSGGGDSGNSGRGSGDDEGDGDDDDD